MASHSQPNSLEDQMKKLVTVVKNGDTIQEQIGKRQSHIEDQMQKMKEELNDKLNEQLTIIEQGQMQFNNSQSHIEQRQVYLESKLDQIMQIITHGTPIEQVKVNTSFVEDHASIPLEGSGGEDTIDQLPNHVI